MMARFPSTTAYRVATRLPNDERDRHLAPIEDLMSGLDVEDDSDEGDVHENDDGSAEIREEPARKSSTPFNANLAEYIDEFEMDDVALKLLEKIDRDKEARKRRDEQYEEGIRRTGMGNDAPGGASFQGASRAVHPMLAEGCVDFAASAMRELFPPNGPARTKIEGEVTTEKLQSAKRQERFLNWQLTEQISEYAEELEQTLTQVPMGGSQYMKFWFDAKMKRVACEFVPIDDVFIPYACADFYSAQRITHAQRLTEFVFEERAESGFYRDLENIGKSSHQPDETKSAQASDKVEGKEVGMDNIDGERIVYEVSTYASFSVDGDEELPYLISIDDQSGKVVSIYRNWDEKDHQAKRLEWIVEYGFIAWRGAYKIGLPHLIGGLSAAATGSLRALLDSALMQTLPGFLRLKGARVGGQSKQIEPMSGVEVEGSAAVDDIRKIAMSLPYNQPSPVLFQLLGWITDAAKGVVTTAEEKISEANSQMPVGTTLALIEQGAKVYSSIHARLHRSQRRAFRIIARLNAKFVSIGEQVAQFGEVIATREDFAKPLAVIPVSDPNIFSETQRYAQMQMVMGVATQMPQAHDMYAVLKRLYETAKIPNVDELLPEKKQPKELNAAAENAAVMLGTPIIAFPEQEHMAHLEVHMRFITDPFMGGSPAAAQRAMPPMLEHLKQHLSFLYAMTIYKLASNTLGADIGELLKQKGMANKVDLLLAAASRQVHSVLGQLLQPLGPIIQGLLKQIAAMQSPPPMDPSQASLQIAKMETDRKSKKDQSDAQLESKALDIKQSGEQTGAQIKDKQVEYQHQDQADRNQQAGIQAQAKLEGDLQKQSQQNAQADANRQADLHKHALGIDQQNQKMAADAADKAAAREAQAQQFREGGLVDLHKHHATLDAQAQAGEQKANIDMAKHFSGLDHQAAESQEQRTHDANIRSQEMEAQQESSSMDRASDLTKHFDVSHNEQIRHQDEMKARDREFKASQKAEKEKGKDKGNKD